MRDRTEHGPGAARRHRPITTRTLGDLQRHPGHVLWASCPRCGRYRTLDIAALAQRFGRNVEVDRLKPLLRCTGCGGRGRLSLGSSSDPAPAD